MAENPAAFPSFETREQYKDGGYKTVLDSHGGMKLRDYFAAKALPTLMVEFMREDSSWESYDDVARSAYHLAAAMMRQREEEVE